MQWWLALPLIVAAWAIHYSYTRSVRRRSPIAERFKPLSRRSTKIRATGVLMAALLAASAIVFALMRPQLLLSRKTPEFQREDLIVILDRSASMRATDIAPSRLVRATTEIKKFLQSKPDTIDRVGLVGFADQPLILSYLTRDLSSIFFYMDWSDEDTDTLYGTNIGAALKSAMEIAQKDTRPSKKIFLLVSDGEDHGDELQASLAQFRAKGYPIECIGIGSDKEVPIPLPDPYSTQIFLTDDDGQMVKTKFEESTLRAIAETTGGRYVRSTTGGEMGQSIAYTVGDERRVLGWKTSTESSDIYPVGLAVAGVAAASLWLIL
jgi:Ca-activated chloride channel family protein